MTNREHSETTPLAPPAAPSARKQHARELFRALPRRYDAASAVLSFGQDPRWRRALVDAIAPAGGEQVLDVATGTGLVAAELLARSACTVVAIDQSPEVLAAARSRAWAVARLHARRPAGARQARLARVGRGRALPRAEHRGLLRAPSLRADRRVLAPSRAGGGAGAAHELRRRRDHLRSARRRRGR